MYSYRDLDKVIEKGLNNFNKNRDDMLKTHVFDNYGEYKESTYINGCDQKFLDKYYNGDIFAFIEDNETNSHCWNCLNCQCCTDCIYCKDSLECERCESVEGYQHKHDEFSPWIPWYTEDLSMIDEEAKTDEWKEMYDSVVKDSYFVFKHFASKKYNYNACSPEFLNKYYKGNLEKWWEDNKTNSHCWNCVDCVNCVYCDECDSCKDCKKCKNTIGMVDGYNMNKNIILEPEIERTYEDDNGNICTQEFLDEYYNGSLNEWLEDNETNKDCFNCTCCKDCYKCFECGWCTDCQMCEDCKDCKDCGRCKHCYRCEYTMDSRYCSKCDCCKNLFMRYDCRMLTSNKLPKSKYIDFCCFETYEKYKEYCKNNNANINGFSPDFMDKYYNNVNEWYADNRTNTSCWNCIGCHECNECKQCKDCYDCEGCEKCEFCNSCKDCKKCKSCKYVSDGDNLKNHEDIEHLYDKPLSDNSKQALKITLLHKDYEEFKQAIDKLPDYIIRNGCTESFLKEYYDDDIEKFIEDNKTNKQCFNCRGCENCRNCVGCVDCYDSSNLIGDKQLACVDLIEQPISELKVKYVFEGGYSDYLLYRVNERQNGCTQEFLDKYYNGDLISYIKDVDFNGNQGCFNCKNCVDCYNCVECMNCEDCSEYEGWDGKKDCSMYVFDDYNDYMKKRMDEEQNGCDQKFLDTHYDGIVFRFIDDNRTNKGCWNCWECRNCDYCTDCEDVEGVRFRFNLSYKFKCVFKDNKEYEKYISETHYNTNGCTQEFLDLYYNSDFDKWLLDNQFNNKCFNCRGCERCRGCVDCEDCESCENCYGCDFLKQCENCVNCSSCENCKGCENNCFGCKYCNDCSSCVYCYNKNNLHDVSGDDKNNNYMTSKEFKEVVDEQLEYCKNLLFKKNEEYVTTDDVFENFRTGANMLGTDVKNTLLGYLTKHLVSIVSMIKDDKQYDIDKWNEKIGDSINYLLLLKGMVVEEERKR